MAKLTDLPVSIRSDVLMLFRGNNYCFATKELSRSPTFYFAQGGLDALTTATLCGRIRTDHPHGPLIDLSHAAKMHFFCPTEVERDEVFDLYTEKTRQRHVERYVQTYRTTPKQNDYHFEYTQRPNRRRPYANRHRSGGTVQISPRITSDTMVTKLIERVLAGPFKIKRGGTVVMESDTGTADPKGQGLTDYLAGL